MEHLSKRNRNLIIGFLIIVGLSYYLDDSKNNQSVNNDVKSENTTNKKSTVESTSRFENPSKNQLNKIKYGLSTKLNIKRSICTKSNSFENVYFIGVEFDNGLVGVWMISGSKSNPGMIFSVNSISQEYSDYPIRDKYDKYEDGYLEVVKYFD
tara:strand:- start:84 stop:542 length:459 start_codon:yes stop_codon:yes gene_type:complete